MRRFPKLPAGLILAAALAAGPGPSARADETVERPGTGAAWSASPVSACCAGVACALTLGIMTVSRPR